MSAPFGSKQCCGAVGREAGFSLVAAVFLIVVLAALAAFAVQVTMTQSQGSNLSLLDARAQAAADAGTEYAANLALNGAGSCRPNSTLRPNQPGLVGFVVKVICVQTSHKLDPGGKTYSVYALTSTATHGAYGQADYVARTVTRNVTLAPP